MEIQSVNWLDFILIAILVIGLVVGLRIGILGALYCTVVVFLGWLAAAQLGSLVGMVFELFLEDDQIATVVSFTVIMGIVVYLGAMIWPSIRKGLGVGTMGASNAVDRVGGLIVGLVLGVAVSGALLVGIMRLTYSFDSTDESVREGLETALIDSAFVPLFVQGAYALPGDSLGLIPGDFQTSLEALRDSIR
ncbi:MAG: CvpA family protein [Dehalococcoidia bacterium]|nr:CvpA family protein [Dehalococcoidia bacterium]